MDQQQMQVALIQLQAQLQAQQLQQVQSDQQVRLLQAAAVAQQHAAPAYHAAARPLVRIPDASSYDGLASTSLDRWVQDVNQQFAYYGIATDAEQVRVACALLKGQALDWWAEHAGPARPATWAAFVAGLKARFQLVTNSQQARVQLDALHQGSKSTADFISAFKGLVGRVPGMTDEEQMHHFLRAVRPSTAQTLQVQGVATMTAAFNMAARVGGITEKHAHSTPHASAANNGGGAMDLSNIEGLEGSTDGSGAPVSRAEFLEMLNAMREQRRPFASGASSSSGGGGRKFGLPTIHGFTPAKVKEYMEGGKCFKCGEVGHQSRGCPKKKSGE